MTFSRGGGVGELSFQRGLSGSLFIGGRVSVLGFPNKGNPRMECFLMHRVKNSIPHAQTTCTRINHGLFIRGLYMGVVFRGPANWCGVLLACTSSQQKAGTNSKNRHAFTNCVIHRIPQGWATWVLLFGAGSKKTNPSSP